MVRRRSLSNPFGPARPKTAPFAGRTKLIQQLCTGLKEGLSFQLYGPPKMGKTSVLRHAAEKLSSSPRRLLPVHVTIERKKPNHAELVHADLVTAMLKASIAALQHRTGKRLPPGVRRHIMQLEGGDAAKPDEKLTEVVQRVRNLL